MGESEINYFLETIVFSFMNLGKSKNCQCMILTSRLN